MSYLNNVTIRLRALEPEDLEPLYRWENDTTLWSVGSTLAPFSRYVLRQYIAESGRPLHETGQLRLAIELRTTKELVGLVDLFDYDPHARRAACGILVDRTHQGQRLATQAVSLLKAYAFGHLDLRQLYVHVPVGNEPSLRLFAGCGFARSGILRDWVRLPNGGFSDAIVMQCLQSR